MQSKNSDFLYKIEIRNIINNQCHVFYTKEEESAIFLSNMLKDLKQYEALNI